MARWPTIETTGALKKGGNCFGLLRIVLSCLVIVSHSYPIGGFGVEPLLALSKGDLTLGTFAVIGFFALSGLLIGISAEKLSTGRFFAHRVRRIFPGYWACLFVTAWVIGPIIAVVRDMPWKSVLYPPGGSARSFVIQNLTLDIRQYALGSTLDRMPYPNAINGSLWSLAYEFACYLVVFAVIRLWIAGKRRPQFLATVTVLSIALAVVVDSIADHNVLGTIPFPFLGALSAYEFFTLWAVFLVGAVVGVHAHRVPLTLPLFAVATALATASIPLGWYRPIGSLLTPYVLVGIGHFAPPLLRKVGARNDVSYGLYLYGFPVGQLLVASGLHWSGPTLAASTCLATLFVAAASWYLVERPNIR